MPKYAILTRANRVPRDPAAILVSPSVLDLMHWLPLDGSLWAVDIETQGTAASDPACRIVGIGLANNSHALYVDLQALTPGAESYLKRFLAQARLSAFNTLFDGTFLQAYTGRWLNWVDDSYGLVKSMSGEGFAGQSWSLARMIDDVLGWPASNKTTMDALLKQRGLTKATMWQLEPELLGVYCAGDADAAWQLREVLYDIASRLP